MTAVLVANLNQYLDAEVISPRILQLYDPAVVIQTAEKREVALAGRSDGPHLR